MLIGLLVVPDGGFGFVPGGRTGVAPLGTLGLGGVGVGIVGLNAVVTGVLPAGTWMVVVTGNVHDRHR